MQRTTMAKVGAVLLGAALVGAACGGDNSSGSSATTAASGAATTAAAGGATTAAAGAATTAAGTKGALAGMKGTTPLVELSSDFKGRLDAINPNLNKTYNYTAETYDAVVIIALAVDKAKTDGTAYASEINGITRGGTKCTDYKSCMAIIASGGDPDYDGQSGPLEFSGNGEPLQASYGILQFGANDQIDDSLTTYKKATAPASADVPQTPVVGTRAGDGVLKIGTILPQTGSLAFLGPPEFRGLRLGHQGHQRRRWRPRQAGRRHQG